jgi:hypothetical protein
MSAQPPPNIVLSEEEGVATGTRIGVDRATIGIHRTQSQETLYINTEEYNWGLDYIKEMARRQGHNDNPNNFRLLRVEFSRYEGGI